MDTSAIYSNQTTFTGKDDKINNDPKNPGVKASMIKNGSGYVFQIQGKDTGAENTLSISSTLDTFNSVDSLMTLAYNGKETKFSVTKGMTAQDLVDLINNRTNSTGVSAKLEDDALGGKTIKYYDSAGLDVTDKVGLNGGGLDAFSSLGDLAGKGTDYVLVPAGSGPKSFSFTYDGREYTVQANDGDTIQDLQDKINSEVPGGELQATWDSTSGQFNFVTSKRTLETASGQALNFSFRVGTGYKEITKDDGSKEIVKDPDSTNKLEAISLSEGSSLDDLVKAFNKAATDEKFASAGVTNKDYTASNENGVFTIKDSGGNTLVRNQLADGTIQYKDGDVVVFETNSNITGLNTPASTEITLKNSPINIAVASDIDGLNPAPSFASADTKINTGTDNWYSQQAQDARFTLNGWTQEFVSSSNTLTDVVEGMTITLKSKGETNLNVVDDKEKLKENIVKVVETFNTMLAKIQELTKYDSKKEVDGPSTTDDGVLNMESQFTWQKGSALTGNYGVQLLRSRLKNVTSGSANGFTRQQNSEDTLNDMFTSLSQIGIKTITDESDPNFGQLEIDEEKLDEAINKDIRNVAELFSADMQGGSNSSNFTVVSTGTKAKAGTYNVQYKVGADGKLDMSSGVYINGAKANYDSTTKTFTVGDMSNPAVGVSITFPEDGLTPGDYSGSKADLITIKDGKVNQMIDQLNDELRPVANGGKDSAGAIPLLIDNYKTVIENIDKKIAREETRLDTLLSEMNNTMSANAAALAQLSTSSSS